MFAALLCSILFSISVACGFRSAKLIGGTEANFWRLTLATLFLGLWSYSFGIGLDGAAFPLFFLSGIIGIGVGDMGLFQALPRLGSRLSLLIIQCLTAPLGALIEWLWLGTSLSAWQILCGLVTVSGVAIALMPGRSVERESVERGADRNQRRTSNVQRSTSNVEPGLLPAPSRVQSRTLNVGHWTFASAFRPRSTHVWGFLYCLVAAFGGAFGAVLSRKAYTLARSAGQPVDGANAAFQRILGGLLLAAIFLLIVKRQAFRVQAHAPPELVAEASRKKWRAVWPWILINSFAGQTLGVSCMQWALETTPTGIVLAIIAITPITVIPVAYLLEGERPTRHSLLGSAIAVVGVIALTLSK